VLSASHQKRQERKLRQERKGKAETEGTKKTENEEVEGIRIKAR